ncbi:MAG: zinc dependent phospholipase C family protein [Pseudomonadota bacterium]
MHLCLGGGLLAGSSALIPPVASLIRKFYRHFLYGSLSADFFVGKGYRTNGGKCHNWETGMLLWNMASDDEERSFAAGFLGHLAADTVAHGLFIPCLSRRTRLPARLEHLYWEWLADCSVSSKESRSFIRTCCFSGNEEVFCRMDSFLCDVLMLDKNLYLSRKSLYLYSIRFVSNSYAANDLASRKMDEIQNVSNLYLLRSLSAMVNVLNLYEASPFLSISPNYTRRRAIAH